MIRVRVLNGGEGRCYAIGEFFGYGKTIVREKVVVNQRVWLLVG